MRFLDAVVLGIVEGITEFLPVSSTGHLILFSDLLDIPSTDFLKSFEVMIQLGAVLAVVALYRKSFLKLALLLRLGVAFFPTAFFGFLLYGFIKKFFLDNSFVVAWALLVGGIALVLFEWFYKNRDGNIQNIEKISYATCFLIGLCQCLAFIPGVSRSAATILGGRSLDISRRAITEFSFLLAVPTIAAATGYDFLKNAAVFSGDEFVYLLVGFFASFVVAILAIRFFLRYIQDHTFLGFGLYRIALSIFFFYFLFVKTLNV